MLFIASIPLPTLIRREIERQLTYQPELETKNRKPLLRASTLGSAWELRFGPENQERARTQARRFLAGSEESKIAWQFRGRSESRPPSSVPRLITYYIL